MVTKTAGRDSKELITRAAARQLLIFQGTCYWAFAKGGVTMPVIRPITDLRNTNEISEICHKQQQPVFITKNGYGDLVVMSMETYEELLSTNQIDKAIFEAEREVAEGAELLDAREALGELRRKHFG